MSLLFRVTRKLNPDSPAVLASQHVSEVVLDRLTDILFATDDILGLLDEASERQTDDRAVAVARSVQGVYDEVNELMKRLTC